MKLIRLKITDPKGFRSLQAGFEYQFRSDWDLQDEEDFAPFVCAGPNGSGKSNLLEVLAAIFYHLECIYLENLPDSFRFEEEANSGGFRSEIATPDGFEIEYLIRPKEALTTTGHDGQAHVRIAKQPGESPKWFLLNHEEREGEVELTIGQTLARQLLPEFVLGYSSGENEILSLPFFKMRFVQFDEYGQALKQQLPYPGRPESRLVYLDSGFSQAILLCNLLFQDTDAISPFRNDVKIEELMEFRIIIRRSIEVEESLISAFGSQDESKRETIEDIVNNHPALSAIEDERQTKRYRVNLVHLLDGDKKSDKIVPRLMRCATCWYLDEASDTLYLDYRVNDATRQAFSENFDFEVNGSPISLFQAFQVLLTLNLFSASDDLKRDLYQSDSLYASETVPILASDQRIMRFKNFWVTKTDVPEPVLLKSFSDGEHQLLHTLGLCMLFKNTQSLFLLDEPETHFNPDWRANFVTRLLQSFNGSDGQEMLVTTHTPFLISDSRPEKVLVFKKADGEVSVLNPDYNTLGASINKITMATFGKHETIGGHAQSMLEDLRHRFEQGEDKEQVIAEINRQLGDSVEKVLLIKTILDSMEKQD
ncbi:restriction system-associated AAA family ATPase [Pseudodesulfovibrio sp. zrk46]|uniref:restriction system-associated AAA family ATPase n=1 Tax=Pseudodesulfovibrio sp. zrk46 TaxID=2725288 RepID=UPI0014493C05|nr:restriction system-associated AAA family ATPase [Pseudodesulfovibrio sp. zrk46]QJB56540.1 restriction system-associated AAA family ATPase [Pseudodesulfovibrio sp. zrk46]